MFTIQSMSLYLCILKLYHARPCAHARLCMLFLISCSPLKYDHRSLTVGHIRVGTGMRGRDQRYIPASCPFDIGDISCLSHVRPARQVHFHVFRPEKRMPTGKWYLSVCCASGATTSILFGGKYGKLGNRWSTR
jgi:hypothetical protein